jgi:hypothetical protein
MGVETNLLTGGGPSFVLVSRRAVRVTAEKQAFRRIFG